MLLVKRNATANENIKDGNLNSSFDFIFGREMWLLNLPVSDNSMYFILFSSDCLIQFLHSRYSTNGPSILIWRSVGHIWIVKYEINHDCGRVFATPGVHPSYSRQKCEAGTQLISYLIDTFSVTHSRRNSRDSDLFPKIICSYRFTWGDMDILSIRVVEKNGLVK